MTTLELAPITEDGQQTNSKNIQDAFDQVGEGLEYDSLHVAAGKYIIDDSVKKCAYSIFGINSSSDIFGDVDENGKPTTFFQLMRDAPLKPFGCDVAIIGPSETVGKNIKLSNIAYDGQCTQTGGKQKYMKAVACPGNHVLAGNEVGKSFHNFIAGVRSGFKNCEFGNIKVSNTAGDAFRTNAIVPSSGLNIHDWVIDMCGHAGILLEKTTDSIVENIKVITRANGAIRLQNGCSDVEINNVRAVGTSQNYNPGFQLAGDRIKVTNCVIDNMMGSGIEVIGDDNTDIEILKCELINCGSFALTNNYGVAGILVNGADVLIRDCLFNGCYQNSISTNVYSPNGKHYTKTGFVITTENNKILDTKTSKFNVTGNGAPIANVLYGHTITSKNNWMMPEQKKSYNVKFLD